MIITAAENVAEEKEAVALFVQLFDEAEAAARALSGASFIIMNFIIVDCCSSLAF